MSSKKWVENIQKHFIFYFICKQIALANPKPSQTLVPLPSSSTIIKLLEFELFKILLVSIISYIKVDMPESILSYAPTLVKMPWNRVSLAELAGTGHPIYANKMQEATDRIKVLFPPILGPVMIKISHLSYSNSTELEIHSSIVKFQKFSRKSSFLPLKGIT